MGFVTATKLVVGSLRIVELTGVLISTASDRFADMRRFYVDVLGLRPRSERPGFVNFDFGHCRLTIAVHDHIEGAAAEPHRVMVNLAVDDAATMVDRLEPARVIRRPEPEKWGGTVATVTDPDGNYVQFLQME